MQSNDTETSTGKAAVSRERNVGNSLLAHIEEYYKDTREKYSRMVLDDTFANESGKL